MGKAALKMVKAERGRGEKRRKLPHGEKRALEKMRREADAAGVELENDGEGGLPPSLVLGVMRRDDYTCKRCGGEKGLPITVHHKGGIVESRWLDEKGHSNDPNNIVTICTGCHDEVHDRARAEGVDSSQKKPKGDKDKGEKPEE